MPSPRTQPKLTIDDLAVIYLGISHLLVLAPAPGQAEHLKDLQSRIKRAMLALARDENPNHD